MNGRYILNEDGEPEACNDLIKWATWFESADRVIIKSTFGDGVEISTVFLGLNHRFSGKGEPILYETMVFGGGHDGYQERYMTKKEAIKGHKKAKELVSEGTL